MQPVASPKACWFMATDAGLVPWEWPVAVMEGHKMSFSRNGFPMQATFFSADSGAQVNLRTQRVRKLCRLPYHDFMRGTFSTPQWCASCASFLWGLQEQGQCCRTCSEVRCGDCATTGGVCRIPGCALTAKAAATYVAVGIPGAMEKAVAKAAVGDKAAAAEAADLKSALGDAAEKADAEKVAAQKVAAEKAAAAAAATVPQSCRGIPRPDLSPLCGDPHALRVFGEMLERERALGSQWAVFYHSYNSPALIYEVQAAIADVLFRFGSRYGSLPRLLKKPFETLPDAAAVLKAFPTWKDRDCSPAFKSVGICCSTSLVSRDPEATPTEVFLKGYAASEVSIQVLEKLLFDCGAGLEKPQNVHKLATAVMALAKQHGLPQATMRGHMGHLLQIFIRRDQIDKWTYASLPYGVPDARRQNFTQHLASEGPIHGQARVVVNPSAFMQAKSVRFYVASASENFHKGRPAFQAALKQLLAPIIGNTAVRERAATGIYGGRLPSWWRDLPAEQ